MKRFLRCPGFFVLRTPALAWNVVDLWGKDLVAYDAWRDAGDIDAALKQDREALQARLRKVARRADVSAAIQVASPSFSRDLGAWLHDKSSAPGKVERTLLRYFTRMASRATPFGLFAGVGVGTVADTTFLEIPKRKHHRPTVQLDVGYVMQLAAELSAEPELRKALRFRAATDLYRVADRLRYVETRMVANRRTYKQVDVEPTPFLLSALRAAGTPQGATIEKIADAVCAVSNDVDFDDAVRFAEYLCDAGLLVSPLCVVATGADPAHSLAQTLGKYPAGRAGHDAIQRAIDALQTPSRDGFRGLHSRMARAKSALASLPVEVDHARLFRTTLCWYGRYTTISRTLAEQIASGAQLLISIADSRALPSMEEFRRRFEAKYGGEPRPLLEVIDPDIGIGFGSNSSASVPLLDGWPSRTLESVTSSWTSRDDHLLKVLYRALKSNTLAIELNDSDIASLAPRTPRTVPSGLDALVVISGSSDSNTHRIFFRRVVGPTCSRLLGRFAAADAGLEAQLQAALRQEQGSNDNAVHAEIVHLPQGNAGNVICRPVLRDYEIPIADASGAPPERQIPLTDLRVQLIDGRVQLFSERLARRVIPHLACAHAYNRSELAAYRFLVEIGQDGMDQDYSFSWGALASAPFLPRLSHGCSILSLARWNFSVQEIDQFSQSSGAACFAKLQAWRSQNSLPRYVSLDEGDQSLFVDLENVLSVQSLVQAARDKHRFTLSEWYPPKAELVVSDGRNRYAHELVVPLIKVSGEPSTSVADKGPSRQHRAVAPSYAEYTGDDWLYFKLFCAEYARDRVLTDLLGPCIGDLKVSRLIDQWFYIRYDQPAPHIRLRIRVGPDSYRREALLAKIVSLANSSSDLITSVATTRYKPEVTRYGGGLGVAVCEKMFEADSRTAIELLSFYREDQDAIWKLTLFGVMALLNDLRFDDRQKERLMRQHRDRQIASLDADSRNHMRRIRRSRRQEVSAILTGSRNDMRFGIDAIDRRSALNGALVCELDQLLTDGQLATSFDAIGISLIHMWTNRMTRYSINLQEAVICDLLLQYLEEATHRREMKNSS